MSNLPKAQSKDCLLLEAIIAGNKALAIPLQTRKQVMLESLLKDKPFPNVAPQSISEWLLIDISIQNLDRQYPTLRKEEDILLYAILHKDTSLVITPTTDKGIFLKHILDNNLL